MDEQAACLCDNDDAHARNSADQSAPWLLLKRALLAELLGMISAEYVETEAQASCCQGRDNNHEKVELDSHWCEVSRPAHIPEMQAGRSFVVSYAS